MKSQITIRPSFSSQHAGASSEPRFRVEVTSEPIDDQVALFDTLFALCLDGFGARVLDVRVVPASGSGTPQRA